MIPAIYNELAEWYRLLDGVDDHRQETAVYIEALKQAIGGGGSLLELGAGAGNNAFFLKQHFDCTLTDISEPMLALSRELNPECEHLEGDMREMRLGREFDAVLIHDAIVYMTTEAELAAALETAYAHTRPGGVAILAPDSFVETFVECEEIHGATTDTAAMRCLEWSWIPDATKTEYAVEYAFLIRENGQVRAIHDRHIEGLFDKDTWIRLIESTGFGVEMLTRPIGEESAYDGASPFTEEVFLCRRPL